MEFDAKKMKRMVENDLLLKRMYRDLGETDDTLEILFNSEVLNDSLMEQEYLKA